MRAIYHPEYKTERELENFIARIDHAIAFDDRTFAPFGIIGAYREELLYDLANRRDDGELRWIEPASYLVHMINRQWRSDDIVMALFRECAIIDKIPYKKD